MMTLIEEIKAALEGPIPAVCSCTDGEKSALEDGILDAPPEVRGLVVLLHGLHQGVSQADKSAVSDPQGMRFFRKIAERDAVKVILENYFRIIYELPSEVSVHYLNGCRFRLSNLNGSPFRMEA